MTPGMARSPTGYARMDDGRRIVVSQRDLHGVREGAYILIRNGQAYLR